MRQVFVDVNISDRGWLVLADNYFPGWKAYLREFGTTGEGVTASGEASEQELPVYRADGTFRAVYLPQAGPVERPLRLFAAQLPAGHLHHLPGGRGAPARCRVVGMGALLSGRAAARSGTVAKNSAVQIVLSLLNKVIDFAFAMLRLRVLGPAGRGQLTLSRSASTWCSRS